MTSVLPVLLDVVAAVVKMYPDIVKAIQAIMSSTSTTDEEKAAALEALKTQLEDDVAKVAAVVFREP